jgi:hypothetical protein
MVAGRQRLELFCCKSTAVIGASRAPLKARGILVPRSGAAFGDIDNDGDLDVLITTNNGPAHLYRNGQLDGNRGIRVRLVGTKSNRDAIGASVRLYSGSESISRMVKSGPSYLSQSELPVTFGMGKRDIAERLVIHWPGGRTEEYKNLRAGRRYECVEAKGIRESGG